MDQPITDAPAAPPAGWYPDPTTANQQRHWDGAKWTDQIAPLPPPQLATAAATPEARNGWGYPVAVGASVALIVGSLAPWATSALESVPGTEVDGQITLVGGIVALVLTATRRWVLLAMIIGVVTVLIGIGDISDVNDYSVQAFGSEVHPASVGWGLWLVAASGVALAVGSSRLRAERKKQAIEEKVDRELRDEEAAERSTAQA
jgi:hypothetical protein